MQDLLYLNMTCVGDQVEILTRESRDRFLGISYFQNSFILTYTDCITVYDVSSCLRKLNLVITLPNI